MVIPSHRLVRSVEVHAKEQILRQTFVILEALDLLCKRRGHLRHGIVLQFEVLGGDERTIVNLLLHFEHKIWEMARARYKSFER